MDMKLEKEYLLLPEVAKRLKCTVDDLIYLGGKDELPIYVLAAGWWVEMFACFPLDVMEEQRAIAEAAAAREAGGDEEIGDVSSATVYYFPMKEPFHKSGTPYELVGPVRLHPDTLRKLEADKSATVDRFIPPDDEHAPPGGVFEFRLCAELNGKRQNPISLSSCRLVVMANDISSLKSPSDETLAPKERPSVLKIIAGMARGRYKHDPSAAKSGAVGAIMQDIQKIDLKIDEDTIRKWIKESDTFVP
jgi:hypothetical protein